MNLLLVQKQKEMVKNAIDNYREIERKTGMKFEKEINDLIDRLGRLIEKEKEFTKK